MNPLKVISQGKKSLIVLFHNTMSHSNNPTPLTAHEQSDKIQKTIQFHELFIEELQNNAYDD